MANLLAVDLTEVFDCEECLRLGLQEERNCHGDKKDCRVYIHPDKLVPSFVLDCCPMAVIDYDLALDWQQFVMFLMLKRLPFSGGYKEQPARLVEILVHCQAEHSSLQFKKDYEAYIARKRDIGDEPPVERGHFGGLGPGSGGGKKLTNLADAKKYLANLRASKK